MQTIGYVHELRSKGLIVNTVGVNIHYKLKITRGKKIKYMY